MGKRFIRLQEGVNYTAKYFPQDDVTHDQATQAPSIGVNSRALYLEGPCQMYDGCQSLKTPHPNKTYEYDHRVHETHVNDWADDNKVDKDPTAGLFEVPVTFGTISAPNDADSGKTARFEELDSDASSEPGDRRITVDGVGKLIHCTGSPSDGWGQSLDGQIPEVFESDPRHWTGWPAPSDRIVYDDGKQQLDPAPTAPSDKNTVAYSPIKRDSVNRRLSNTVNGAGHGTSAENSRQGSDDGDNW